MSDRFQSEVRVPVVPVAGPGGPASALKPVGGMRRPPSSQNYIPIPLTAAQRNAKDHEQLVSLAKCDSEEGMPLEPMLRLLGTENPEELDSRLTDDEVREIAIAWAAPVPSADPSAAAGEALAPLPTPPRTAPTRTAPTRDPADGFDVATAAPNVPASIAGGAQVGDAPTGPAPKVAPRTAEARLGLREDAPWPTAVDGAAVLDELVVLFRRYAVLPDHGAETLSLWTVFTYLLDVADVSPRLWIHSPDKECGKTVVLGMLASLVSRALPSANVSTASIFRILDARHPTLLFDEFDNTQVAERPDLLQILNSGHTRAFGYVMRVEGEGHEPTEFSTWGAIAFAGIRGSAVPDTLASRSIRIEMRRMLSDERVARFRAGSLPAEVAPCRQRLVRWASDNQVALAQAEPTIPTALGHRQADNWRLLFAIADAAGEAWGVRARDAAIALSRSNVGLSPSRATSLLADVRDAFDSSGGDRMASSDLLIALNQAADRPWGALRNGRGLDGHLLASLLREFGVESARSVRIGDRTPKGYLRESLEDAFKRYLPPSVSATARPATTTADSPDVSVSAGSVETTAGLPHVEPAAIATDVEADEQTYSPFDVSADELGRS